MSAESVVTVSKARRILGDLAIELSDDQVKEILHTLHLLAKEHLCYNGSKDEEYGNVSSSPVSNK
jgi:hypothetical protein